MLTPRHYQLEGIEYCTTPNVCLKPDDLIPTLCRHILSDAPGAGKTPQSIWSSLELLVTYSKNGSVMILAPAHLCKQWFDYLCEHFKEHRVVWLEGSKGQRTREAAQPATFYIMSIQSLRFEHYYDLLVQLYIKQRVQVTIIDESHYVKNPDAITSKRVRTLTRPEFCPHVILLSATPIVREANDLYMQLRICDPHTFHRQDVFMNTYCWFNYGSWGYTDVMLRKGAAEQLRPWMWGRTYAQIGLELPPVIQYTELATLTHPRRKAYDDMRNYWYIQLSTEGVTANSSMEAMHMLRHLTACPEKAAPLTQYMQDDPGPYLVACFYRASASFLANQIRQAHSNLTVTVITGETPATERRELVIAASKQPNSVVVATIPSISEGVDLSHCNTVYFFEEDYTPGRMYQFLSRVRRHRDNTMINFNMEKPSPELEEWRKSRGLPTGSPVVGSISSIDKDPNERPIIVRYFHADKTIDQRIHAVQSNRAANAKDIIKLELGV